MTPMKEARDAITAVLETLDVGVHTAVPEVLSGPGAVIVQRDPWVTPVTLGQWTVNYDVQLVVTQSGNNEQAITDLEDLAWKVCEAFLLGGVRWLTIEQVSTLTQGNTNLLSATIPVAVNVTQ